MGRSKALLPVGGRTLIEWQVARLQPRFAEVLVSAADSAQVPAAVRPLVVLDRRTGQGPLAALESGLEASAHEHVFCLACDMPLVPPELGSFLIAQLPGHLAAVPLLGEPEPVCAAYRRSALARVRAALDSGERRLGDTVVRLPARLIGAAELAAAGFAADVFLNLNRPQDFEAFLGHHG